MGLIKGCKDIWVVKGQKAHLYSIIKLEEYNSKELIMKCSKYRIYTKLKDNNLYGKAVESNYGELDISCLERLINDNRELKVGYDQNLHILKIDKDIDIGALSIIACAGARYCSLSLWNIKEDIESLNLKRFHKYSINVGFSGCLKGCGRHHHNHIGIVGLRTNMFGNTQKALRVFIGATEVPNPSPARLLYYAVPKRAVDKLFTVIIEDYIESKFEDFNQFGLHLLRFKIETLQIWYIIRQLKNLSPEIFELFFNGDEDRLLKIIRELKGYPKRDNFFEEINILSHKLWDDRTDTVCK